MDKEFSAGAIIFRRETRQALFLLIYSGRNKIWGFPKGHIEPGEVEKSAALREIKEETGITDLRFVDGFREEDVYQAVSNRGPHSGSVIEKHSVYFLCETKTKDIVIDAAEITDHKWLGMYEAEELLIFDSLKRLLRKAEIFAHTDIPKKAKWKKVAISHRVDRYVLDVSKYGLPYYEVKWMDPGGDDHEVYFIVPGDYLRFFEDMRDIIDKCNKYASGPYYDHIKAIKEDSRKRGLPTDIEAE